MAAKSKLSDGISGTIAKAEAPATGQRFIFDDHRDAPRGFGLRITAAGGKAFILKYSVDGQQRRMTIGTWPTWTLTAARERARELTQQIDSGVDPLESGRRRRLEPTVADAAEDYVQRYVSGLISAKPIARYFERDLIPVLGTRQLASVTRRDLIDLIEDKAAKTPAAARRLLAHVKPFFDWCVDREMIPLSPAAGIKPKSIVVKAKRNVLKPVRRKRVLSDQEIVTFWRAIEAETHKLTALALKLTLVTGQRPGEVAGLHETEISGDVWTIPAHRRGKTETAHKIGLTPLALDLIKQARAEVQRLSARRKAEPTGYLFETRPGQPLSVGALPKAVLRHAEALGNQDDPVWRCWRPHDLRRTCRTGLSRCGIPDEIAERVIGHVPGAMVDVYNQHDHVEEKRRALLKWETVLRGLLGELGGNVMPIRKAG